MRLRDKYTWIKHLDFILIDLACLIIAFFISYYLKFSRLDVFADTEWKTLFLLICFVNLLFMFLQSTYSGILRRSYFQQFNREINLFFSQVATICIIFYALKIGTNFSREMLFLTYFLYFAIAQPIKYFRKKYLVKQFPFSNRETVREIKARIKNERIKEKKALICLDDRTIIHRIIKSVLKRMVDILGGLVGCLILIPLTIVVFILNKLNEEDDGPVFYVQERIGQYGKPFRMYKYRSMVVDADEKLEKFLAENEDVRKEFMVYRKIKNDPRVTRVGKFLRKTSLDEFPQFINVLMGDMSIVGPRPYLKRELEQMGKYYDIIIQYKPGITGLWQIKGRSDVTFDERLDIDIEYHKKNSLFMDLNILFQTFVQVITKKGAI